LIVLKVGRTVALAVVALAAVCNACMSVNHLNCLSCFYYVKVLLLFQCSVIGITGFRVRLLTSFLCL